MSALSRILKASEIVEINSFRATQVEAKGGLPENDEVPVLLAEPAGVSRLSGKEVQDAYGLDSEGITFEILVEPGADVAVNDLVEVTAGRYDGEYLEVRAITEGTGFARGLGCKESDRRPVPLVAGDFSDDFSEDFSI